MKQKIQMNPSSDRSIEEAYQLLIKKAKVRNLSEKTIQTYNNHYKIFSEVYDTSLPLTELTEEVIDNFTLYLREKREIGEVTVNSYLRTMRAFCYYCMECGYLKKFNIKLLKETRKIKETYTSAELERLLAKPNINSCTFTEFKIWVFENYLLGTGNRISTALDVHISDIRFDESAIILRKVKNRMQQIIPLSNSLASFLEEYLEIRGGAEEDYLFCNIYGEHGNVRTFQDLIKKYNEKRNVEKSSAHLFRHTFAKNWILAGGDIFRLQKILGHSDLTVTKQYVQMFGQDLQMDFEKFNPLDRMKKNKIEM